MARDASWFVAGLLVALAVNVIMRGWLSRSGVARAIRTLRWPAVAALILAVPVLLLYTWLGGSRHNGTDPIAAASVTAASADGGPVHGGGTLDAMLTRLEGRLRDGNGSAADWDLLAQTYDYLGRKADAGNARQRHVVASATMPIKADEQWPLILAALAADHPGAPTPAGNAAAGGTTAATQTTPTVIRLPPSPRIRKLTQQLLGAADQARKARNYAVARSSYEQLVTLGQMSAQSWADYADVVASQNGGRFDDSAHRYIEAALELDPANEKALWLEASAQHDEQHYARAVSTWTQLLALSPAGSANARIFADNLAQDRQLASGSTDRTDAMASGAAAPEAGSPVQVNGEVTVADSLKLKVPTGLTVFIVAKSIDSPGAPVAVIRTRTGEWPLKFILDDSLAMLPERKLSTAGRVMIEARVSLVGTAASQPGDLQSAPAIVDPHSGKPIRLVIDHIIG
jgi:cytochrome c-type biogenesis protein CcmH/NrfG